MQSLHPCRLLGKGCLSCRDSESTFFCFSFIMTLDVCIRLIPAQVHMLQFNTSRSRLHSVVQGVFRVNLETATLFCSVFLAALSIS